MEHEFTNALRTLLEILMRAFLAGALFIVLFAPCSGQTADTLKNDFLRNRSVAFFSYLGHLLPTNGTQQPYGAGVAIRIGTRDELRLYLGWGWQDFLERQCVTSISAGYFRYAYISQKSAFVYGAECSAGFAFQPELMLVDVPGSLTLAHSRWGAELSAGITYSPISVLQLAGEYRLVYWHNRGWTDNDLDYEISSAVRISFQFRIW